MFIQVEDQGNKFGELKGEKMTRNAAAPKVLRRTGGG